MLPTFDNDELNIARCQEQQKAKRARRRSMLRVDRYYLIKHLSEIVGEGTSGFDWMQLPFNWKLANRAYFCSNRCSCGRAERVENHLRKKRMRRWKQERNR